MKVLENITEVTVRYVRVIYEYYRLGGGGGVAFEETGLLYCSAVKRPFVDKSCIQKEVGMIRPWS